MWFIRDIKSRNLLPRFQIDGRIMRGGFAELLIILGLLVLCLGTRICLGLNFGDSEVRCIEEERQALLKFKQGLEDDYGLLSSWGSQEDCCKWKGIKCSNQTGRVVKLDHRANIFRDFPEALSGEISSSLLGLQHLTYLDLSCNYFSNPSLPNFIGSLTKLQYLNLSYTGIFGTIPQQLGNLTSLVSLDLRGNGLIEDHNLEWLSRLSSLRYLDMTFVNLSKAFDWPDKVSALPSLKELHLVHCQLISMPIFPVLSNVSSSSPLSILELSTNHLNSSIFPWLFKYANSLVDLHLGRNKLEGSIPKAFGNMVSLVVFDLSFNNLEGVIPHTLENLHDLQVLDLSNNNISGEVLDLSKFSFLRELHLSKNRLNGSLTKTVAKLSMLQVLDVSSNSLEGDVTEAHLSNLSILDQLDLSFNSLSLKFSPAWVPPFHLDTIGLSSCKLGLAFPLWLQTQKNFSWLDMSNVGISDTIPYWFWDLSSNIQFLNLSHNQITGTIPLQWFSSRFIGFPTIDLSYNCFNGLLPQLNNGSVVLNLSNNLFMGSITSICETNRSKSYMDVNYLDLSDNFLSGELSSCWEKMPNLIVLNLANNNLSGRLFDSIGGICDHGGRPRTLHLQNNNFIGGLPKSLMNCSSLKVLDLGENKLSGRIPTWIGTGLPDLVVLRLPSNLFIGRMPLQLCHLTSLQILDLSHNNITGTIPLCLSNFTAMAQKQNSDVSISYPYTSVQNIDEFSSSTSYYFDHTLVIIKGKYLEYKKTLGLVKMINLSSNKLKGEIPGEISSLSGLIGLNISKNLLSGIIPWSIGDLDRLESLDLPRNHLSGIIPPSLASLSFLSYLNLSNNNLSGRIPTGTQLQSFSGSAYLGNLYLCGLPLPKRCLGDEAIPIPSPKVGGKQEDGNIQAHASIERLWFYIGTAFGFVSGFWGVCGLFLLKPSWRHAYYRLLDRIGDRLYVAIAINKAKLLRNFKTRCQRGL